MPGEEKTTPPLDKMIYANGRDNWAPEKYERFGLYVFLYNYVRANLDDFSKQPNGQPSKFKDEAGNYINFDLDRNALSTQINQAIYKHYDWFVKHLHLDEPIEIGKPGKDLGIKKETFLSEFYDHAHQSDQLMQMNNELGGPLKGNSADKTNMSTSDLLLILRHKEDNVRKYFDNVRNAVEGKPRDLDSDGKPKGGYLTIDMTKALQEKEEFNRELLEGAGTTLFYGVITAGGAGLTVFSVMGILSFGGIGIPTVFATTFVAAPFGMFCLSALGLIVGVKTLKNGFGKTINSLGNEFGQLKKYFHFMVGMGEYAPKDGIPRGFNARKERYETGLELKTMMTKFKIPERAADFNDAFEAFWKKTLENSKYLKRFTPRELKELHKNAKYTYQVTNGLADGQGASLFGRLRGLVSAEYPNERVDYKFENADEAYRHFKSTLDVRQSNKVDLNQLESDLMWLDANRKFFEDAKREDHYKELLDSFKDIIITSVDNFAFTEPLNSQTLTSLERLLTNQATSERIKSGITGGEEQVQSVISFIKTESTKGNIKLAESYPESTIAQLEFDKDMMVDACTGEGFGPEKVTGEMVEDVKTVAEFISKYSVEDEKIKINGKDYGLRDIEDILKNNIKANRLAYEYLSLMLEKRSGAATLDTQGVLKYAGIKSTKLNLTTPDEVIGELDSFTNPPDVHAVVNKIMAATSSTSEADIAAIKNTIEVLNFNDNDRQNKNYLYSLLSFRIGKVENADILEEIVSEIAGLDTSNFDNGSATDIREKVANSGLPVSVCLGLTDWALSKQDERLQKKKVNEVVAQTMKGIRKGGCVQFQSIMNEIEALTYETINDSSTLQLFDKKIMRGQSSPFKEYFALALREKVQKLISDKLVQDGANLRNETGLEKNAEYLQFISTNRFLTDVQKEELFAVAADYIEAAACANIQNLEKEILRNKYQGGKPLAGNISTYLNNSYSSKGLKEFFESGTARSTRVKDKLATFNNIANSFADAVTPSTYYGGLNKVAIDPDSADSKFIVSAFFRYPKTQRQVDDPLLAALTKTRNTYDSMHDSVKSTGTKKGEVKYNATDIQDDIDNIAFFKQIIAQIDEIKSGLKSDVDKLAALRNIKRFALETFKFNLLYFISDTAFLSGPGEIQRAINTRPIQFENFIGVWKEFVQRVDNECVALVTKPEIKNAGSLLEGQEYISAVQTIGFFTDVNNIHANLKNNNTIQPGR